MRHKDRQDYALSFEGWAIIVGCCIGIFVIASKQL